MKALLIILMLAYPYYEANSATTNIQTAPSAEGLRTLGPGLPLPEFLRILFSEYAHKPYILAPSASGSTALISVDLSMIKVKDPIALLRKILTPLGYSITIFDGVYFVDAITSTNGVKSNLTVPAVLERFIYQPKNQSILELSSYFTLFPSLNFILSNNSSIVKPASASGAEASSPGRSTSDPSFLVVTGEPAVLVDFKSFLSQIDVPTESVEVRAYILEVRNVDESSTGIQVVTSLINGHLSASLGSTAAASNSFTLGIPGLSASISAATSDSRVRLLSSPVLRASDGQTATSSVGAEVPTLGSVTTSNGAVAQSIVYQPSGMILSVTPKILGESIRINVSQEQSSFVRGEAGATQSPTKLKRSFKSDIVLTDGQAVLVGGLTETSESKAGTSFFGLPTGKSTAASRSDIVLLLHVQKVNFDAPSVSVPVTELAAYPNSTSAQNELRAPAPLETE